MFIELIVVVAVVMYLYTSGLLSFSNPYAIFISISIVMIASTLGWIVTHYIARSMVDNMFGFGDWVPRGQKKKKTTPQEQMRVAAMTSRNIAAMEQLVLEVPNDIELSKRLSDEYYHAGMLDKYVAERLRIVETNLLTLAEVCSTFNRLADIEIARGRRAEAISYLKCIIEKYPQAVEAGNAEKRIAVLEVNEDSAKTMESEA